MAKTKVLGTALWGWSVSKEDAFSILTLFYNNGGRYIDTATNYPMSGNSYDWMLSIDIISEWANYNSVLDLKVIVKFGSVFNYHSSITSYSEEYIQSTHDILVSKLSKNLYCLMVHWDNSDNEFDIYSKLKVIHSLPIRAFGLSGIKYPSIYTDACQSIGLKINMIEFKSNFLVKGEYHYENVNCEERIAYGISVSGLKLNEKDYRKDSNVKLLRGKDYHSKSLTNELKNKIKTTIKESYNIDNLYDYSVLETERNPNISAYIIAPSSPEQMIDFLQKFGI